MRSSNREARDALIAEATVDCYNDSECVTGFHTMIDDHLEVPFQTRVLGADVPHAVIDELSRIEQIKGQCARNVLTAARNRRQMVARALASCAPDEWISVDARFTAIDVVVPCS